ncbi:MAG: hypothetical protein IPM36_23975 [Lewinellaceae bacterium]|nr:hypothetical protein [Lewinellaceae bacterium]
MEFPFHFILSYQLQRLLAQALILFGWRASWNLVPTAAPPRRAQPPLLERLALDLGIGAGFRVGNWGKSSPN